MTDKAIEVLEKLIIHVGLAYEKQTAAQRFSCPKPRYLAGAILSSLSRSAPTLEGWKLVPVEPDNGMICAALEASLELMKEKGVHALSPFHDYPPPGEVTRHCYRAMVAASPSPSKADE